MIPSIADLDRELVRRRGLYEFARLAWPLVEPSPFVPNWHLEEISRHLEAVSRNEISRLIINVPPGTGKSLFISVFWPSWEWIHRPQTKWFSASYDSGLVARDAKKMIDILQSTWFVERWGSLLPQKNPAMLMFENAFRGFRFGTSVRGKGTGRHGDIQVVDDPIKPKDVLGGASVTKTMLRQVSEWWSKTMASRRADPRTFRRVIVMQRLHEEDLAGEMLAQGGWEHLCLPMLYEPERRSVTSIGGDRRTEKDDLLFKDRYPADVVEGIKIETGPDGFQAQYQQRPTRPGGNIFRREWWRFWHHKPNIKEPIFPKHLFPDADQTEPTRDCAVLPGAGLDVQSWDCAFKGKQDSDFVAGGVWRSVWRDHYLMAFWNERLSFTGTVSAILHASATHPYAYDKLIENAANGPAVEDTLKAELRGITLVDAQGGKESRAHACTPAFAAGQVFLPHPDICPKIWTLIKQLESFPNTVNDDMVDMVSQYLVKMRKHGTNFQAAMAAIRGEK